MCSRCREPSGSKAIHFACLLVLRFFQRSKEFIPSAASDAILQIFPGCYLFREGGREDFINWNLALGRWPLPFDTTHRARLC